MIHYTSGFYENTYIFTDAQETDLLAGLMYVNIHSSAYPGGEIRGQISTLPDQVETGILSGRQEVPPNLGTGLGTILGTYDDVINEFMFDLTFVGLSSPTTAAHLHSPAAPGVNAPVQIGFAGFPIGVTSGFYKNTYILTDEQESDLLAGLMYVNIHSMAYPGGEIRAQLSAGPAAVPDQAGTVVLLGLGIAGLAGFARLSSFPRPTLAG